MQSIPNYSFQIRLRESAGSIADALPARTRAAAQPGTFSGKSRRRFRPGHIAQLHTRAAPGFDAGGCDIGPVQTG